MTVLFDEALQTAMEHALAIASGGLSVAIVRDVLGRCRLVLDDRQGRLSAEFVRAAGDRLQELGPYCARPPALLASDLLDAGSLLATPGRIVIDKASESRGEVSVIERTLIGSDWWTVGERPTEHLGPDYLAFYSLKGGVGRSTAAVFLARALAERGRSVLLVDLDLESPGLSSLVLDQESLPLFGVVDLLAEAAVGNNVTEEAIVRSTHLQPASSGQIWVLPAGGRPRPGYQYLPKLDRAYLEIPGDELTGAAIGFGERLLQVLELATTEVAKRGTNPSVVILDCRAGLHDLAGVALTHIADLGLLFAGDTAQTWWGYRTMFEQWAQRPEDARRIRERLKIVAALVDKSGPDDYLAGFTERAADCFSAIYDQGEADDPGAFSPSPTDRSAPHFPLPIFFDGDLRHIALDDMERAVGSVPLRAAFDVFVQGVEGLLRPESP